MMTCRVSCTCEWKPIINSEYFHGLRRFLMEEFIHVAILCSNFTRRKRSRITNLHTISIFRRGTNKESSMIRTKVLTPEHAAVNTQQYKYYVQNQYFHRPNNIPERRRLPCEVILSNDLFWHLSNVYRATVLLRSKIVCLLGPM